MTSSNDVPAHLGAVFDTIRTAFLEPDTEPWIVAYSGGKDSTLLLHLVWEVVVAAGPARRRPIYVVSNDTLVESPLVIGHLRRSLDVIRAAARYAGLPITVEITEPCIDQTFWVNVIGRGYIPPTRNSPSRVAPRSEGACRVCSADERWQFRQTPCRSTARTPGPEPSTSRPPGWSRR